MSDHQLVAANSLSLKFCAVCGKLMTGISYQAIACTRCDLVIHKSCECAASKLPKCAGKKDQNRADKEFRGQTDGQFKSGRPCVFEVFAERCLLAVHKSTMLSGKKDYEWPILSIKVNSHESNRVEVQFEGKSYQFRLDTSSERDAFVACLANVKEAFSTSFPPPLIPQYGPSSSPSSSSVLSPSSNHGPSSLQVTRRRTDPMPPAASAPPIQPVASLSNLQTFSPSAPPLRATQSLSDVSRTGLSASPLQRQHWECRACTFLNTVSSDACEICGTERGLAAPSGGSGSQTRTSPLSPPPQPPPTSVPLDDWTCDVCTLQNGGQFLQCMACYTPRRCADPNHSNEDEIERSRQAQKALLQIWRSGNLNETAYKRMAAGLQGAASPTGFQTGVAQYTQEAFELPNGVLETVRKQWYDWETKMWMEQESQVLIDWRKPLGQGNLRVALYMLDRSRPPGQQACVAKYVKEEFWDDERGEQQYYVDVEMQVHCQAVANAFNKANPPKTVSFLEAWVISRSGTTIPAHQKVLAAEPYMDPTCYEKHNNNWGFVHPVHRNTPQAFSHFSWEYTHHRFMIVDIQGVGDVYTDPQIHSADDEGSGNGPWGMGNMGLEGIMRFLGTHRCNAICKALGLQSTQQPIMSAGTQVPTRAQKHALGWNGSFRVQDYIRDIRPVRDGVTQEDLSLLKIDMDEFNTIVDMFTKIDRDGNGVLTMDEVVAMLSSMGDFQFSPENTRYLMELARTKEVTFKQFLLWYKGIE